MIFLIKKMQEELLKIKIGQTKNQLKNYAYQLLKNLENENTHFLWSSIWGTDPAARQLISKITKLCICFGYSFERLKGIHNY